MSESARFRTFEEFWPFYVKEHSLKSTRWMHFAGTTMALGTVAAAGCTVFIVHARNAWLKGLSPKENREIPPMP